MGNEVNEVINNICDKLGYAASEITPEMARYMIAKDWFEVIAFLIIDAILIAVICLGVKSYKGLSDHDKEWNSEAQVLTVIISGIGAVIITAMLLVVGTNLVGWIASPRASMVEYVLKAIG